MTSIIKLQAISGVNGESPPCYILQVDEFRFMLDCGWNGDVDSHYLKEMKKHVPKIDALLLSHPDEQHLGALPYLVGQCDLSCPIYSTIPVFKMGQMFLYDYYLSRQSSENFKLFDLDDVDLAFDRIVQLKYNQSINLKGKGYGLTITPIQAGHLIGGAIWKILKIGEEDIYYAIDYNHKKERHLNGCELEKIQRPSLFITDAFNMDYTQERRRTRDEQLLTNILQTLRNSGNVLIAVDTAGRVLELAHMLDQLWRKKESGLSQYSLVFLNNVAYNVMEFAKSQIEWMSDKISKSFEGARNNPFQFKNVHICHTLADMNKLTSPKVVLASSPDLESGFSRDIFMQWCNDKKNCIILTTRSSPGTLGRTLLENAPPLTIELEVRQRVRLEGLELEDFYRKEREKEYRVKKEKREAMVDSDDSDDSDAEIKITGIYHGSRVSHDLFIKPGMEARIETGLFKSSKSKYPVFPFVEEKIRFDEYGEYIKHEDFIASETLEEPDLKAIKVNHNNNAFIPLDIDVPTKCTRYKQVYSVNCQVVFIDFEGRSDGESIQKIIEQMKPRRLIITRGSSEAAEILSSPELGQLVDVTTESLIYQVKLKDALVSSLEFQRGRDAELAWIDGNLLLECEEQIHDEEQLAIEMAEEDPMILIPTLQPLQSANMQLSPHSTVFVNELKLSDFKTVLTKHGIASEFSGGVLWCSNGSVALRRQDAGKVTVEGALSDDYYSIRDLLYQQYAIL